MQLNLFTRFNRSRAPSPVCLSIGSMSVPVQFVRNIRARRYILRVRRDGLVRVTIPRGGAMAFALDFARKNSAWIERELLRRQTEAPRTEAWKDGTEVLLHGEPVKLHCRADGELQLVHLADHVVPIRGSVTDLRPTLQGFLWSLAEKELVPRTLQLAALHGLTIARVVVRNQRSRWGSCSPRRTISLNWRLIQAPLGVRDYLIVHELMHIREMNHSPRFWRLVQAAWPEYQQAEAWLDEHAHLLR